MHVLGWYDGMIVWNDSITTILYQLLSVEASSHEPLGYQNKQLI